MATPYCLGCYIYINIIVLTFTPTPHPSPWTLRCTMPLQTTHLDKEISIQKYFFAFCGGKLKYYLRIRVEQQICISSNLISFVKTFP